MNKKIVFSILIAFFSMTGYFFYKTNPTTHIEKLQSFKTEKKKKKTQEERMLNARERELHELHFQINPLTGEIPKSEKEKEYKEAMFSLQFKKATGKKTSISNTYVSRGPSNLGGRTRALVIDASDTSGNTIISGGVSSGVFRTTDGGNTWTKVSNNDEIHNVTTIAQDPRAGFQNVWYYGTGELTGNSATLGSTYRGLGVWKSVDGGITWSQIAETSSDFHRFDSFFDFVNKLEVNPVTGDLFIATTGRIYRYDGVNLTEELVIPDRRGGFTDVVINKKGRVYAAIAGNSSVGGVHTSPNGNGSWTKIAENDNPSGWSADGRIVLGTAPSNDDALYVIYENGKISDSDTDTFNIEADLWKYNFSTSSWTNYSSKMPDEEGGDLVGNDPFAVQGGYDLEIAVKPDDENFVVIGGTNIYRIRNITSDETFTRIGGYKNNLSYATYDVGGVDHHPDIHELVFDTQDPTILFSGTDGGVHKTDVLDETITWTNLNNNYLTYQYYFVTMLQEDGNDIVFGGAQDNGTTIGGTDIGFSDNSTMFQFAGGDGVAVGLALESTNSRNLLRYYGFQNGPIFRFNNGFTSIRPENSESQFVTYFYLDPDNSNALYYAGESTLYATNDSENVTETTWRNLGNLDTNEFIRTFATTRGVYDSSNSYLFIGGQNGGIFRLKNPQNSTDLSSAKNITPSEATTNFFTIVSGIAVHPTNPDIVLAVYSNYGIKNIFLTTNATADLPTWTLIENNLDNHSVRSAAITQVGTETRYFVGTARGLYSSTDPTNSDWEIEGSSTIGLAVISSLVYRPSDNKLLVGTHGNGMFETTVQGVLSTNSFKEEATSLNLYPNPANKTLNINGNFIQDNDKISYEIFNYLGKSILKGDLTNTEINIEQLEKGAYILNVLSKNKRQTLKFVKQ